VDVQVGELTSTVRATDSAALLSPVVLEQITQAVLARLRREQDRDRRIEDERRLLPTLPSVHDLPWERP
jgi:hypothetical protein